MKKRAKRIDATREERKDQKQPEIDWKAQYLRVLADYQNLEKRTDERIANIRKYAAEDIVVRILPVVDTFDNVRMHLNDAGLDLAYKELIRVLSEQGVAKIEVFGKEFDPMTMECIEVVDGQDNVVVVEVLPGYRMGDKVLRVAKVKVGRNKHTNN